LFFWLNLFSGIQNLRRGIWGPFRFFIVIGLALPGKGWYDLKRVRINMGIKTSEQSFWLNFYRDMIL